MQVSKHHFLCNSKWFSKLGSIEDLVHKLTYLGLYSYREVFVHEVFNGVDLVLVPVKHQVKLVFFVLDILNTLIKNFHFNFVKLKHVHFLDHFFELLLLRAEVFT